MKKAITVCHDLMCVITDVFFYSVCLSDKKSCLDNNDFITDAVNHNGDA